MTKTQLDLLLFIRGFIRDNGYCPSFDEMRVAVGCNSKSGIHRMLTALEEQGQITRLHNRARAIEIPKNPIMPRDLSSYSLDELAREARRRGLALGHVHRDKDDKRTFKEI